MRTSTDFKELPAALAKAQAEAMFALKDVNNPFFHSRYADLASNWDVARKPLTENGLSILQSPSMVYHGEPKVVEKPSQNNKPTYSVNAIVEVKLETRLSHESGEWVESEVSTLLPSGDPQAIGSAITYLRRYGLAAMVGISPDDDDGEGAQGRRPEKEPERPPYVRNPQPPAKKTEPEKNQREPVGKDKQPPKKEEPKKTEQPKSDQQRQPEIAPEKDLHPAFVSVAKYIHEKSPSMRSMTSERWSGKLAKDVLLIAREHGYKTLKDLQELEPDDLEGKLAEKLEGATEDFVDEAPDLD